MQFCALDAPDSFRAKFQDEADTAAKSPPVDPFSSTGDVGSRGDGSSAPGVNETESRGPDAVEPRTVDCEVAGNGGRDHPPFKKSSLPPASFLKRTVDSMNLAAAEEAGHPAEDMSRPVFDDLDSLIMMFKVGIGDGVKFSRKKGHRQSCRCHEMILICCCRGLD